MTPEQVAQYIGRPWVSGEWDCWASFRHWQKTHYGIEVPMVDVDALNTQQIMNALSNHEERANWRLIDNPRDGDAVLMSRNRYPSHIGLWVDIDGGKILHCAQGAGVVCQSPRDVGFYGWPKLEFYRRR